MKKKIIFRCDGATLPQIGTGHVRRDIAIAEMLIKEKICLKNEISFVTRRLGSFKLGYDLIKKSRYSVEKIEDRNLNWNSKKEANSLSKLKTRILVIDRLSTNKEWISCLINKFKTLVSIDDTGSGAKIADVVINGIFHNLPPKKNRFIGYKYLFLKNIGTSYKKKICKNVNNIVVTFGGYDRRNLTNFFLNCLFQTNNLFRKPTKIEILVGFEKNKIINNWKKLIKKIEAHKKVKIKITILASDYFKRLSKADLAIVSGGLSVFDCIARGIPVIGLPQYQHQLKTLLNLESNKVIKLGSLGMSLNEKNFMDIYNKIILSFEDRVFLSKNSINLIDRKGPARIIKILGSLF
tara:strand:+ start:3241 stop:4293 length:1053 start_codon:yes stop_codon:yes gene_type:complete